ncbi:MBL fold metallo-hydrolase [Actinoplanes sp. NPDC049265]|uniref:MBL fold metallo-hydrolase n=1 Tax=Actinoplanes sp. NPDC049265 TaxID=3363902 RepID=UPI003720A51B
MTDLAVTRVGHSCHLIEIGGRTLLTDPWFTVKPTYDQGERVAFTPDQLPPLDAIVISHEHYDHCDLDALLDLRDVPVIGPGTVAAIAREKGWKDVRELEAWDATQVGDVTVTAAPGKHGVHEVTFVLQGGGRTVFFGGDSLLVPEMAELPQRFGAFDLALLPTNGLCIRPLGGEQVVMNAAEAAELTAILRPRVAIPHHYAFTSGRLGDLLITKGSREPLKFAAGVNPETEVRVVLPGQRVIPVSGS